MPKASKKNIVSTILIIALLIIPVIFLFLSQRKNNNPEKRNELLRESVPNREPFQRQITEDMIRGTLYDYENDLITLSYDPKFYQPEFKQKVDVNTYFKCVKKTITKNGVTYDRGSILIKTDGVTPPPKNLTRPSWDRGKDWFDKNVLVGDIIEFWYADKDKMDLYSVSMVSEI